MKFSKKIFIRMGLLLISLFIAILIAEGFVRIFQQQMTYQKAYDYGLSCYEKSAYLPFTLARNKTCRMFHVSKDFDTTVTTNSHGYRSKEFSITKPQDRTRILVLGDSFTFGWGVSDKETYPSQLEEILTQKGKKVEVINAGFADGFSPDSYYAYLKHDGLNLNPDIIVLGFLVYNDISDLSETVWKKTDENGLPTVIESCCRTVDKNLYRNKSISFRYAHPVFRDSHAFLLFTGIMKQKFGWFMDPEDISARRDLQPGCGMNAACIHLFSPEEEKMKRSIEGIKNLTDEKGIPFIVVLIPADFQLYPDMMWKYHFTTSYDMKNPDFIQKRLSDFFEKTSVRSLDLFPVLDKKREEGNPYFSSDAHFNALGHSIAADAIASYLSEHGILNNP